MAAGPGVFQPRLREFRERRGLTQQEVAEELTKLAWSRDRQRVGVNADMVSKWERGEKRPSRMYRDLYCLLFRATPAELSLAAAASFSDLLEPQLPVPGLPGRQLQSSLHVSKDEFVDRRSLLVLLGAASLSIALPGRGDALATTARSSTSAADVLDDADRLAARYQQLYHSVDPTVLLSQAVVHLDAVSQQLKLSPAAPLRRRLLENYGQVALLAGRLALFDLSDVMSARAYLNTAAEAAHEAGSRVLAAVALGHSSFVAAAEQRYAAAASYLQGAEQHSRDVPLVTSWLNSVEAEIQSNAGSANGALAALDRAHSAMEHARESAVPVWFDFYDESRLAGFAGFAYLQAGRLDEADRSLRDAADRLPTHAVKQRSVALLDLATVQVHRREVDEACRLATEAVDSLSQAGYATGTARLLAFRPLVQRWKDHPGVRLLDEQLAG